MAAQAGDTPFSIASLKAELRSRLRSRRAAQPRAQLRLAARAAARRLMGTRLLRRGDRVALYLTHGSELDTAQLIEGLRRRGIGIYAPVIGRDGSMLFVRLRRSTPLQTNRLGVLQPATRRPVCPISSLKAVVLPLLGFDARGHRLGHGGGYYDRALSRSHTRRRPLRLGFAYAAQEVETIPVEPWDLQLDGIVTDNGLRHFRR